MKTIQFKCPHCGQSYECSAADLGAEAECEKCGHSFRIDSTSVSVIAKRPTGIGCYLGVFRRYFGFKGRMSRRDFWWAFLFNSLLFFAAGIIDGLMFDETDESRGMIVGLATLVTLAPMVAAYARRLHDTGKSGWWVFLSLLPPLNLAFFVWLAQKGDVDSNRFGESGA